MRITEARVSVSNQRDTSVGKVAARADRMFHSGPGERFLEKSLSISVAVGSSLLVHVVNCVEFQTLPFVVSRATKPVNLRGRHP